MTTVERRPAGGKLLTIPFLVLAALAVIALYFLAKRFIFGIGAVSNMSDGSPWGIWIAYDVVIGTAFACGGYAMALLIYVFNRMEYSPLLRPAILASLLGYTLAGLSVIVDIGRYWQAYNIFLPWLVNPHSVMFEVALCIAIYILVLWVEFTPAFLERWNKEKLHRTLNRVIFAFIALGILLPTMHQSSLGTMMLIAGYKLSPLWRTAFLPLLFLLTAITMGYAIVIFETTIASMTFRVPAETRLLGRISRVMAWLLGFYLLVRFEDVNLRGHLDLAFSGSLYGNMFLLENGFFLAALLLLAFPRNREKPRLLFAAALALLLGGSLYRFNTYITGFDSGIGWSYFPSVPELMITLGIIAVEILGYLWLVKRTPVLPARVHVKHV
jgi:Ni/Fe-hydrogenase subunit HybB-like protein